MAIYITFCIFGAFLALISTFLVFNYFDDDTHREYYFVKNKKIKSIILYSSLFTLGVLIIFTSIGIYLHNESTKSLSYENEFFLLEAEESIIFKSKDGGDKFQNVVYITTDNGDTWRYHYSNVMFEVDEEWKLIKKGEVFLGRNKLKEIIITGPKDKLSKLGQEYAKTFRTSFNLN